MRRKGEHVRQQAVRIRRRMWQRHSGDALSTATNPLQRSPRHCSVREGSCLPPPSAANNRAAAAYGVHAHAFLPHSLVAEAVWLKGAELPPARQVVHAPKLLVGQQDRDATRGARLCVVGAGGGEKVVRQALAPRAAPLQGTPVRSSGVSPAAATPAAAAARVRRPAGYFYDALPQRAPSHRGHDGGLKELLLIQGLGGCAWLWCMLCACV